MTPSPNALIVANYQHEKACFLLFVSLQALESYKSLQTHKFAVFIIIPGSAILVLGHSQTSPGGQLSTDSRQLSIRHATPELPA